MLLKSHGYGHDSYDALGGAMGLHVQVCYSEAGMHLCMYETRLLHIGPCVQPKHLQGVVEKRGNRQKTGA